MSLQKFQKPSLSIKEHIDLLVGRGLIITDLKQAEHYLEYVGYYRLSGYFSYFYQNATIPRSEHKFLDCTHFSSIADLYEFDTSLRSVLLGALERLEIAVRAAISNYMSLKYGAHWYLDRRLFKTAFNYDEFIEQIKKETEFGKQGGKKLIFRSYYGKYSDPYLPASWMICEALSFGTWSRVYSYLSKDSDRNYIAKKFSLPYPIFESWLQAICVVRNLCAHHSMVCYRNFHFIPKKPTSWSVSQKKPFLNQNTLHLQLFVIHYILRRVAPHNEFIYKLSALLKEHPEVSLTHMGFDLNWEQDEIWK